MSQQEEKKDFDQEVAQGSALVVSTEALNDEGNCVQDTQIEETATLTIEPELAADATSEVEDVTDTSKDMHTVTENDTQPEDSSNQQATEGANSDAMLTSGSTKTQMSDQGNKSPRSRRKKKKVKPLETSGFDESDSDEEPTPKRVTTQGQINVIPAIRVVGDETNHIIALNTKYPMRASSPVVRSAKLHDRHWREMPYFPSGLRTSWSPHEFFECNAAKLAALIEPDTVKPPERRVQSAECKTPFEHPRAAPTPTKSKGHRRTNAVSNAALPLRSTTAMLSECRDRYKHQGQELKNKSKELEYAREIIKEKRVELQQKKELLKQAKSEAEDKIRRHAAEMTSAMANVEEETNEACAQLRVNSEKYESRLELLQQELDQSLDAIKSIEQDRDDARASLLTLQTTLEERTAALKAAETRSTEMQTSVDTANGNLSEFEARNNDFQAQLDEFLARDRGIDQKTAKLQSHLRQLSRQLDGTHDMIEKLQTQNADLERTNRRLEHQIALRRISEARSEPWNKRRKAWRQEYAWIEEHKILKQRAQQEDLARAEYESAREYTLDDLKLPEPNDAFEFYQKLAGRVVRVPKSAAKSAAQDTSTRKPTWLSIWRNSVSQSFSWYW